MQIITTAVIKGGTGKTTTAAAIAQAAAAAGKKVLAIDLDPQGNLSFVLAAEPERGGNSCQLLNGAPARQLTQRTQQGVEVVKASADLAAETTKQNSINRLTAALQPIKSKYQLIIIDTPPTMGELTYNALMAATDLIIPLEADLNSLQGLLNIAEIAAAIQEHNELLKISGIILTRYDPRPKINRQIKQAIEDKARALDIPFLMAIRKGIAITEAQATQQSLFEYAPKSKPAQDYLQLYQQITKRKGR